jgi:asparagine synthase (glutamine-hydrolysing)
MPMKDQHTGVTLVYNGEIYNHIELRNELITRGHTFASRSDSEVLLRAYIEWGYDCFRRFNGMWAVAIADPRSRTVLLSRDRLGVKPLYCAGIASGVVFASEPKAILSLRPEFRRPDAAAIGKLIGFSRLYDDSHTFYEGVRSVPAGTYALLDWDSPSLKPAAYWSITESTRGSVGKSDWRELFQDSVKLRLRSDVPVGLTLSGGIDSTSILAVCTERLGRQPICFTSRFEEDETSADLSWAVRAAKRANVEHIAVDAPKENWISSLREIVKIMDGPGYSPAVYPLWLLMGRAREMGVKVILEGQGADETFGGYPQHHALAFQHAISRANASSAYRLWISGSAAYGPLTFAQWILRETVPQLFSWYQLRFRGPNLLRRKLRDQVTGESSFELTPGQSVASRMADDLTKRVLPGLLQYGDAVSMAQSVEARQPYLDYRLIEAAFSLLGDFGYFSREYKRPLKQLLRDSGYSDLAAREDKSGYATPVAAWLREGGGAIPKRLLLSPNSRILEFCERPRVQELIEKVQRSPDFAAPILYKVIAAELWLQECIS